MEKKTLVGKLKKGDVLSESSHYVVVKGTPTDLILRHFESGQMVNIAKDYIEAYINNADQFDEVVKVTKEDKKDGTFGIRSIFENISTEQVFTVCFKKQDKPKTKKAIAAEIDKIVEDFSHEIDTVKAQKKGVAEAAKRLATNLIEHPILPFEEGEDRVLRGYKVQFSSRDGKYKCVDMDIEKTDKEDGVRLVNINTIKWIIFNNKKYIVG